MVGVRRGCLWASCQCWGLSSEPGKTKGIVFLGTCPKPPAPARCPQPRRSAKPPPLHSPSRRILILQSSIHKFSKSKWISFHTKQMPSLRMSSLLRLNNQCLTFQIPLQPRILHRERNHCLHFILQECQSQRLRRFKTVFLQISKIKPIADKRKTADNKPYLPGPPPGSSQKAVRQVFLTRFLRKTLPYISAHPLPDVHP